MTILIRLPNWLGDTIMLTPTLSLLDRIYPSIKFIFVGNELSSSVFKGDKRVLKIFVDKSKEAKGIFKRLKSIKELAASINEYILDSKITIDYAITTQNNFFSAFLLSKIYAKSSIGYGDKNIFGLRKLLLTHSIKFKSGRSPACNHQVLSYANLLLPILPASFYDNIDLSNYVVNKDASVLQNKLFSQIGDLHLDSKNKAAKNIVAISPNASYGISKMWLPSYFSEVAIALIKKGYRIRIYGAKGDIEHNKKIESSILQLLKSDYHASLENLTGKTSIKEFINSLQECSLYIGNDSGNMHIAKALNIPSIVFFGPMPLTWCSPWSNEFYQKGDISMEHVSIDNSVVIKKNLPCMPCYKRECPLGHHNCMKLITPDEVIITAESMLLKQLK